MGYSTFIHSPPPSFFYRVYMIFSYIKYHFRFATIFYALVISNLCRNLLVGDNTYHGRTTVVFYHTEKFKRPENKEHTKNAWSFKGVYFLSTNLSQRPKCNE